MKDDNCIFCKLANGDIPTNSIYEDEAFRIILDASPASRGHALIIPKEHYRNIYELPDDMASKVLPLAKKAALHMTEVLSCDGFNIVQNNNEVAGQTVFHFHMHLIPRYAGEAPMLIWKPRDVDNESQKTLSEELRITNG